MKPQTSRLSIRYRTKSALLKLPFGLGSSLVMFSPIRRLMMSVMTYCRPLLHFMRRRNAKIEANIILSSILRRGLSHAVIVYDNLASPPTYGDYLYVVL